MSKSHKRAIELLAEKIHFSATHRWVIYLSSLGLALTGLGWLVLDFVTQDDKTIEIMRTMAWFIKIHGVFVMMALVVFGTIFTNHIRRAWYLKRHLITGISLLALWLVMAVTGLCLYYFVSEDNQWWISTLHWAAGVIAVIALPLHVMQRRKNRRSFVT